MIDKTLDPKKCDRIGVDYKSVKSHQAKLLTVKQDPSRKVTFDILDTCRTSNQFLLKSNWIHNQGADFPLPENIISVVLAGGASSRYFAPLGKLMQATKIRDFESFKKELKHLIQTGAASWALPASLKNLLSQDIAKLEESDKLWGQLSFDLELPKALLPCTQDGLTFLELKSIEDEIIPGIAGQAYITPLDYGERFMEILNQRSLKSTLPFQCFEQNLELSTLRFNMDGSPAVDDEGNYSPVPAGHGAIVKLFPQIKAAFPDVEVLLIRNIDNVVGKKDAVIESTRQFLQSHFYIFRIIQSIRLGLDNEDLSDAVQAARPLLDHIDTWTYSKDQIDFLETIRSENERDLWRLQLAFFSTPVKFIQSHGGQSLKSVFDRPVNTLGQVPNSGTDVGGTPVLVDSKFGPMKICLEVPHASQDDKRKFLEDPKMASHFNPVFIASEARSDISCYEDENSPFWLLAQKHWKSKQVLYHETLLSEILGNSYLANCVFLEIPRILFNPHKTLDDTIGRTSDSWACNL